jgi:hypothetical protein
MATAVTRLIFGRRGSSFSFCRQIKRIDVASPPAEKATGPGTGLGNARHCASLMSTQP